MDNQETRHYAILYQDEKRLNYTVYESVDLANIADVYAEMVAFENMMHTFPNMSCKLYLTNRRSQAHTL